MVKPSLTIFANFRIDNYSRFQRMKDSFESFKEISASKWVINVRGSYKLQTIDFLNEQLDTRLSSNILESKKGWFSDSKLLLNQINTDYILFWVEDHFNMAKNTTYDAILHEMSDAKVDHLILSWWHKSNKDTYSHIDAIETENLKIYTMNISNIMTINSKINKSFYMVGMQSILSYDFFQKILENPPKFRRWPKETPFDFEKIAQKSFLLPFKTALPKVELFANFDDDNGVDGYSLISRGLFESTQIGDSIREIRKQNVNNKNSFLVKITPQFFYIFLGKLKIFIRRIIYSLK